MAQGFLLTSSADGSAGGDLDIHSLAEDSDAVVRDAVVLAIRTRRNSWYHNPMLGLDPEVANLVTTDQEIRAILEADIQEMFANMEGFTLTTVNADRIGTTRDWAISIVGVGNRLLVITTNTTL